MSCVSSESNCAYFMIMGHLSHSIRLIKLSGLRERGVKMAESPAVVHVASIKGSLFNFKGYQPSSTDGYCTKIRCEACANI